MASDATPPRAARPRGFAAMTPERRREISSLGGKALPAHLRSFAQNRDLASKAGALGGHASRGGGRGPGSRNTHK
jgi:uncharacterized protein